MRLHTHRGSASFNKALLAADRSTNTLSVPPSGAVPVCLVLQALHAAR